MAKKNKVKKPTKSDFSVKVEIECSELITYKQTVMIRPEDYEKIKDLDMDDVSQIDNQEAYAVIQNYIDPRDIYDAPNSEYELVTVKKM